MYLLWMLLQNGGYCGVVMWFSEFVKNPQIVQFLGNQCTLRRTDGALVTTRYSSDIV